MALQRFRRDEFAAAFEHHINAEIAPGNLRRIAKSAEAQTLTGDTHRVIALGADISAPFALQAVKGEQMRGGCRPALEFVEMNHLQTIAGARIISGTLGRPHRGAQRQPSNPAHAVNTDLHCEAPPCIADDGVDENWLNPAPPRRARHTFALAVRCARTGGNTGTATRTGVHGLPPQQLAVRNPSNSFMRSKRAA